MKKVWKWIKKNWLVVVAALGALLVGYLLWRKGDVPTLSAGVAIQKKRQKIAEISGEILAMTRQDKVDIQKVEELKAEAQEHKREIVAVRTEVEGMSDDEVNALFDSFGY